METGQGDRIVSECSLSDKCSRSYQGDRMGRSLPCHTRAPQNRVDSISEFDTILFFKKLK